MGERHGAREGRSRREGGRGRVGERGCDQQSSKGRRRTGGLRERGWRDRERGIPFSGRWMKRELKETAAIDACHVADGGKETQRRREESG